MFPQSNARDGLPRPRNDYCHLAQPPYDHLKASRTPSPNTAFHPPSLYCNHRSIASGSSDAGLPSPVYHPAVNAQVALGYTALGPHTNIPHIGQPSSSLSTNLATSTQQYLPHVGCSPAASSSLRQPSVSSSLYGALDFAATKPQSQSSYKLTESTGRRKSETSTSQARRNSSTNPYPRSRRDGSNPGRVPRPFDTLCVLNSDRGPVGPTNHLLVPQDAFFDAPQGDLLDPISFRAQGFHEPGVKLTHILRQHAEPIEGPNDMVLANCVYREIKIKIHWPGYPHHPFEKRMKTLNHTITRTTVCLVVANAVLEFVMMLKDRKVLIADGYEGWRIGKGGLKANEFWITGLLHRGGNYYQPEVWVPF